MRVGVFRATFASSVQSLKRSDTKVSQSNQKWTRTENYALAYFEVDTYDRSFYVRVHSLQLLVLTKWSFYFDFQKRLALFVL